LLIQLTPSGSLELETVAIDDRFLFADDRDGNVTNGVRSHAQALEDESYTGRYLLLQRLSGNRHNESDRRAQTQSAGGCRCGWRGQRPYSDLLLVPLPTVYPGIDQIGQQAAKVVLLHMGAKQILRPKKVLIAAKLESCFVRFRSNA
jgi:hypothetical protein